MVGIASSTTSSWVPRSESLGITEVEPILARVRMNPDPGLRALNHLLLRVRDDRGTWLADVGFGGGGLLNPLPFQPGSEMEQSGWTYRLVEDGPELVLQSLTDGEWRDLYGFLPEPARPIDIEVNNWYTATHPESSFVTGIMTGLRLPDRCLSLFVSDQPVLVERPVDGPSTVTELDLADVPGLLADRFGIRTVTIGPGAGSSWSNRWAECDVLVPAGPSRRDGWHRSGRARPTCAGRTRLDGTTSV